MELCHYAWVQLGPEFFEQKLGPQCMKWLQVCKPVPSQVDCTKAVCNTCQHVAEIMSLCPFHMGVSCTLVE
jgi:hypothetical protein